MPAAFDITGSPVDLLLCDWAVLTYMQCLD